MKHARPSLDSTRLDSCRLRDQPRISRHVLWYNARVVRREGVVDLSDVQVRRLGWTAEKFTHPSCFDGNTLLVLSVEGVTEETDRKVKGRRQHTVPRGSGGDEQPVPNSLGRTN